MTNQLVPKGGACVESQGEPKKKRLLCRLGLHQWDYSPAVYQTVTEERLALPAQAATRTCRYCPKSQVEDRHCLGLNPPEYVSTWYDQS